MLFFHDYPELFLIQKLAKKKRTAVYLVGGFLRDALLKQEKGFDWDFAVERNALVLAREFARHIKGAYILLDKEHGCARVAQKKDGQLWTFDFADFRARTFREDVSARDFTINTLACAVHSLKERDEWRNVILDFKNGKRDLKNRVLRMVSAKSFQEDPLRILRAFSLRAQLNFRIERRTLARLKKDKDLLAFVSPERIREEFFKILESPRAAENLKAMDQTGVLKKAIPQITLMYDVKQGGYHHLDVWPHALQTVKEFENLCKEFDGDADIKIYLQEIIGGAHTRRSVMKFAALLHDIGKPQTKRREKDRMSFHGHELAGKTIVKQIARQMRLSTRERIILQEMVLWHLRPGYLSNFEQPSPRAVFRYFRDTQEEAASIAFLSLADQRATRGPLTSARDQRHHEKICRSLIAQYFKKRKEKPFIRLINGDDLIRELKLTPSPLFAVILREVEEQQAAGFIKDKTQALEYARKIASRQQQKLAQGKKYVRITGQEEDKP